MNKGTVRGKKSIPNGGYAEAFTDANLGCFCAKVSLVKRQADVFKKYHPIMAARIPNSPEALEVSVLI